MRRSRFALLGSLAWVVGFAACAPPEPVRTPNILLITLDTTRRDHLGVYGYERPTSPELDRLAKESVVYDRAYSTSSWTLPAHASIFTGKFLSSHGASYDPEGPLSLLGGIEGPKEWKRFRARGLAEDETTLAELLSRAGYRTGAVVAGPWLKRVFGLDRGFTDYDDSGISSLAGRPADAVADRALTWLDARDEAPFFLFLNFFDPHGPYAPPAEAAALLPAVGGGKAEATLAAYDGEIRYMDTQLGRVLAGLRERGLWDSTWVIITADHGELFGENGRVGHGRSLTEPEIRIPLLIKYPGQEERARRSDELIQLTAILPMIAERLNLDVSRPTPVPVAVLSQLHLLPGWTGGNWDVLVTGEEKLVRRQEGGVWLFDLASDPRERFNLTPTRLGRVQELSKQLDELLRSLPAPLPAGPAKEIDSETREALENLGYID